jgi:hypothetical protein
MDPQTRTVVILGVLALCAIVGIYYCVARRLGKSSEEYNLHASPKDSTSPK